jgi:hypothetical protein
MKKAAMLKNNMIIKSLDFMILSIVSYNEALRSPPKNSGGQGMQAKANKNPRIEVKSIRGHAFFLLIIGSMHSHRNRSDIQAGLLTPPPF